LEARFIDSIEHKLNLIADRPAIGSLRYARVLQRSNLRSFPEKRFQYLGFYIAFPDRIDVLPILHGRRDIPAILQAPSGEDDA
jgi:toxin ParE1/3/4